MPPMPSAELQRWFGKQYGRPELAFWGQIAREVAGTEFAPPLSSLSVEQHLAAVDRLLQRLEEFGAAQGLSAT